MRLPLRPMQPVSIQIPQPEGPVWYPSLVIDFKDGQELILGVPTSHGQDVVVEPGTTVFLELPLADGLRRFEAKVRGRTGSPPALRLSWPETGERIQRRENSRVEASFKVEVAVMGPDDRPGKPMWGMSSDLSAGGIRVVLAVGLPEHAEVELVLHLPRAGTHTCLGRVLRGGLAAPERGQDRFWSAVEFTQISEAVRREINKVVFDLQREQIRRG